MKKRISDLLDGYEDGSVKLSGDTPLSSARIKELTMKQINKKKNPLPRVLGTLAAAAACLGLVILASQAFQGTFAGYEPQASDPAAGTDAGTEHTSIPVGDERPGDGCGMLPGNFEPVLNYNGTRYRWMGLSLSGYSYYQDEDGNLRLRTYLPEGFEAVGEISVLSHTAEGEPGELQMKAGFEAAGTVYANPECPAVVYVLMTTDWFADAYVRFTADYYRSGLFRFGGKLYWFPWGTSEESEPLRELPTGCVSAGNLHVIDKDLIPANDLEINFFMDGSGASLEGREIFRDPADDSVIYLFETQYWQKGSYPMWVACHLWTAAPAQ